LTGFVEGLSADLVISGITFLLIRKKKKGGKK